MFNRVENESIRGLFLDILFSYIKFFHFNGTLMLKLDRRAPMTKIMTFRL